MNFRKKKKTNLELIKNSKFKFGNCENLRRNQDFMITQKNYSNCFLFLNYNTISSWVSVTLFCNVRILIFCWKMYTYIIFSVHHHLTKFGLQLEFKDKFKKSP